MFSDTFTDSAIGSRINGDHREKVLQRWDGGDSNGENFDLDADTVSSTNMLVYPIICDHKLVYFFFRNNFFRLHMLEAFYMPFSVFQSNGWDASEMFRFNEETYGVKSTYDSSLSMYTYVDVLSFFLSLSERLTFECLKWKSLLSFKQDFHGSLNSIRLN